MKRITFYLLLVFAAAPAFAQVAPDPLLPLKQHFETYRKKQPAKLFLHTDRSFYASADTVWYKAYLTDPQTYQLHPVSEIVYLDLISEDNRRLLSQRLKTESGTVAGSLVLPDTLKTGEYLLQVYTNFQRNAGEQTFFRQPIWINKVPVQPGKTVGNLAGKVLQLQFYPEGGKLLPGFESKVGFKATTATGENAAIEGKVLDETGKTVTAFRSNNTGLGSFSLRPEAGKTYRAQVLNGGEKMEFPLEVTPKGYALSLKNPSVDSVTVLLAAAQNLTVPAYLVLQSHGNLLAADSVQFNAKGWRKRRFSTRSWPEGVVQVTLLNAARTPENERLFFHRNARPLQVKLETTRKAYGRREPVSVNISLRDEAGQPVEAELSVAVTNSSAAAPTLREQLLLASEIKDTPRFISAQPTDIDNLLLTQTLRNFSWDSVATATEKVPAYKRETELNQTGTVTENGEVVKNAVIYLLETNSGKTYLLTSDAEGNFRVPADGNSFFYQIWQNGLWRENARLTLLKTGEVVPSGNWQVSAATDSVQTKRLTLRRQIDRMYQAEPQAKTKLINTEMWPTYPANDYYPLADYNQLNTMEEILREMVPSVRVVTRKKKVQANVYNKDTRAFYPNQPLYIIDGQPTWNNDLFLRLDASQLEQVNVYNSAKTLQPFGFMGNNGVIVVFTKSRNYQNPELSGQHVLKVPGKSPYLPFRKKDRPAHIPDFRPTLYWNPALQTNAQGQANFTFKTSDEMGNVRVQVEGITKDGRLISEELLIPVQPAE